MCNNYVPVTLPIVDARVYNRKGGVSCEHSPKTEQDKFKNPILFCNSEYLAFLAWKQYYPGLDVTFDDYKRNYRKYRYRVRAIRVSAVWTRWEHDDKFGIWYFIDDTMREPECSRRIDDARHYFIEWMKYVYGEEVLHEFNANHVKHSGDKSHWEQHITSTARTWGHK